MHSVKRKARNLAWAYGDEDTKNYNPFAKRSRSYNARSRSQADEENQLRQHNSVDAVPSSQEATRMQSQQDYASPPHANTDPTSSASRPLQPTLDTVVEKDASKETSPISSDNLNRSQTGSTSHQAQPEGAHKRRKFFSGLLGHVDRTQNDDAEEEEKKPRRKISPWSQVKATLFGSWINVLLICVPIGFALRYTHVNGKAIFVVNFIAIIPLAAMLSFATEELALYVGETLGGLLNASFGNATELIVGVIALAQGKILIVQTSLIGSMLSNLLLVLGMCFFFGGVNRKAQYFNQTVAQTAASLLALSIGSLIIPTAFVIFGTGDNEVSKVSRGTSILLLLVYACYLLFQLKTHVDMYNEPSKKSEKITGSKKHEGDALRGIAQIGAGSAASAGGQVNRENLVHLEDEDTPEVPTLSVIGALTTLLIATVFIAFCSEFMVSGIDSITNSVSEEFVGLILIPIVGNAAEHATAVTVAIKDKMDLAIGVAVGSSMQIALLVLPLMVVIGWCGVGGNNPPMTLDFDGFQVSALFIAVLLVNYLIQDGASHWLEGILLMTLYIIIAVSAFFYPATNVA